MRNSRNQDRQLAEVTRRRIEALAATLPPAGPREEAGDAPGDAPVDVPAEAPPAGPPSRVPGRHARRPVSLAGRGSGWVADRVPATMRGRVHLGAAQLGLVALVVAVGLTVTTWWMVRAGADDGSVVPPRPVGEAVASSGVVPGDAVRSEALDAPVAEEATVVVDVAGRVRSPGIAVLPAGSRVVDALEAAGGVRRGVDLSTLNLARVLVDGEQVLVGAPAAESPSGTEDTSGAGALVSINTADQATLETLPGVGPVTAAAIVAWREENGAFAAVEELLEVSGIGPATLAELLPHVTL